MDGSIEVPIIDITSTISLVETMMRARGRKIQISPKHVELMKNLQEELNNLVEETAPPEVLTVAQLEKSIPQVDWARFLRSLVPETNRSGNVSYHDNVLAFGTVLMKGELSRILEKYDPSVISAFLVIRWSLKFLRFASPYVFKLNNLTMTQQRWNKSCFMYMVSSMPIQYGLAFTNRFVELENINATEEVLHRLVDVFLEDVEKLEWMDQQSRKSVTQKVKNMKTYIGIPKQYQNSAELEAWFEKLNISRSEDFLNTMMKVLKGTVSISFSEIAKKQNSESSRQLGHVNAFYNRLSNTVVLGSPIVRLPYFDRDLPAFHNYATFGNIMAHEVGHGFDRLGILYNEHGKMTGVLSKEMQEVYDEYQSCLIETQNSYEHPKYGLNKRGNFTLTENTADNVGFKIAYHAFQQMIKDNPEETHIKLPGFQNQTTEQMFFYSLARSLCGIPVSPSVFVSSKEAHSISRFRVNGIISNAEDFGRVFNCPRGTKMNPKKKCNFFLIWERHEK